MSKNYSITLARDDMIDFCHGIHCTENEIGKVIKNSVIGAVHSPFYRKQLDPGNGKPKVEKTDEQRIREESKDELQRQLGIKKSEVNELKKLAEKGIHFKNNVERYLYVFIDEWMGDWHKINELVFTMKKLQRNEIRADTYSERYLQT